MGTVDDHLLELARKGLGPGEQPRASLRVSYNGTTTPNTFTIDSGLAALGGTQSDEAPDPDRLVRFPVANQMVLLLTDRRLLVWSTGMRGKPKSFLGDVPLRGVREVRTSAGRLGAQLEFVMKSGALVDVEGARGEDVAGFVAEATAALGVPPA